MRTTLNIDAQVVVLVREFSEQRRISLGEAASFLIERGLSVAATHQEKNGFALFTIEPQASTFGLKDVERAVEQDDEALSGFFADR